MYRSVHRFAAGLFVAVVAQGGAAAPIHPVLPCDRPVLVFGGSTILAEGVRVPDSNDFAPAFVASSSASVTAAH